jgi:competence protein CoiA
MMFAIDGNGNKVSATPKARAFCRFCGTEVVAKCGRIISWHWSHANREDCDSWSEGETRWHLAWKEPIEAIGDGMTEVLFGPHRADICLPGGLLIELQNSAISSDEIEKREQFYTSQRLTYCGTSRRIKMRWIFNAIDAYEKDRLDIRGKVGGRYCTFRWKHARQSIFYCNQPVYLDVGEDMLEIKKMHREPFSGWGYLHDANQIREKLAKDAFIEHCNQYL